MSKLGEPEKGLCIVHFLRDEFLDHVPSVDIDRTYGHDFLSISLSKVTEKVSDECVELRDL